MAGDVEDFAAEVQRRYCEIVKDMRENGYLHLIWCDWKAREDHGEMLAWLEARDHMTSYISPVLRVCFAFKKPCDALLFKLTWGGA